MLNKHQDLSKSDTMTSSTYTATSSSAGSDDKNKDEPNKLDISSTTLEALRTLSSVSSTEGIMTLSDCDKLSASLEKIRASNNIKLFEKLDNLKKDFSGLNNQLAQMEQSMVDLKKVTSQFCDGQL